MGAIEALMTREFLIAALAAVSAAAVVFTLGFTFLGRSGTSVKQRIKRGALERVTQALAVQSGLFRELIQRAGAQAAGKRCEQLGAIRRMGVWGLFGGHGWLLAPNRATGRRIIKTSTQLSARILRQLKRLAALGRDGAASTRASPATPP